MKRPRLPPAPGTDSRSRELRVIDLIATKRGDADRGPQIYMHARNAAERLLTDGELAWVYGARRHELATVVIDDRVRLGDVVLRDLIVAAPSETVRVVKPDLDTRGNRAYA
jgi:anaerobic selenocysteine-containing dehydrogenase